MRKTLPALITSALLLLGAVAHTVAAEPKNLVPEGSFEILNERGEPEFWKLPHPSYLKGLGATCEVVTEEGNRFMRLTNTKPGTNVFLTGTLEIPEGVQNIRVSVRIRTKDIVVGPEQGWYSAMWDGQWLDADKKYVKHVGSSIRIRTSTEDWIEKEQVFQVRPGAKYLMMNPGLWGTTGTMDIDDIRITAEQ